MELPGHLHLAIGVETLRPTALSPAGASSRETSIGPFPNEIPFKFRQGPEDMED
jgi:hypothetical protein